MNLSPSFADSNFLVIQRVWRKNPWLDGEVGTRREAKVEVGSGLGDVSSSLTKGPSRQEDWGK